MEIPAFWQFFNWTSKMNFLYFYALQNFLMFSRSSKTSFCGITNNYCRILPRMNNSGDVLFSWNHPPKTTAPIFCTICPRSLVYFCIETHQYITQHYYYLSYKNFALVSLFHGTYIDGNSDHDAHIWRKIGLFWILKNLIF